jgi:hypothetical protein
LHPQLPSEVNGMHVLHRPHLPRLLTTMMVTVALTAPSARPWGIAAAANPACG